MAATPPAPGPTGIVGVAALAAGLLARPGPRSGPRIVAVDGWSGSGKTSLAGLLGPSLDAPCVHLDDFVPGWDGLAASVDLLVEWVLRPLGAGRPARWCHWDWATGAWGREETLPPGTTILIEGCGAGAAPARPWLDALVWLDVDPAARRRHLEARPDWDTYEPWAGMWADQEQRLRRADDPAPHATVVLRPGPDPDTFAANWR